MAQRATWFNRVKRLWTIKQGVISDRLGVARFRCLQEDRKKKAVAAAAQAQAEEAAGRAALAEAVADALAHLAGPAPT